jgi:hypothetical protein
MRSLSELELRILAELEEAQAEEIFTVINTVIRPTGNWNEVNSYRAALTNLVNQDFVLMVRASVWDKATDKWDDQIVLSKAEALTLMHEIEDFFQFEQRNWVEKYDHRSWRRPVIWVTDKGYKKAVEILDERGYQWWRRE